MNNRQKISLIFLTLLLMTLFGALYLSKQSQEIREKAAGCSITFISDTYPTPDSFRQVSPGHYQVLTSASPNNPNQFKINWNCDMTVTGFRVKNGNNYIETSCKSIGSTGASAPCQTQYPYCLPSDAKMVICENLPKGRYDISLEFYTTSP